MESSEVVHAIEIEASSKVKNGRVPTGIEGFDDLIEGGIPKGYLVLLAGTAGSGKTIFASEYLHHGLSRFNEPGVYVSFAEDRQTFMKNMTRMDMDFEKYEQKGRFKFLDLVTVKDKGVESIVERMLTEIGSIKAQRLVIDSFSALAQAFSDKIDARIMLHTVLGKIVHISGVTTLLISERPLGVEWLGSGMEEFVADGVVALSARTERGWLRRIMQVLKLRGTRIKTLEHTYDINGHGIRIQPEPEIKQATKVFTQKMSTGTRGLDLMLRDGVYEGSTTLVAGASGTGKTTAALHFFAEGVKRNERCLYIATEEPTVQLTAYGEKFGWNMDEFLDKGSGKIVHLSPESFNAEQQFQCMKTTLKDFKPSRFVIDCLSPFKTALPRERYAQQLRSLVSHLKADGVTSFVIALGEPASATTETGLSTLVDNIIFLRYVEIESVLRRSLVVIKARMTAHDNDIREFEITPNGIVVKEKFTGLEHVLGGAPRRVVTEDIARAWAEAFGGKT
jgi:circadian clock protein KaiC